MKPEVLIIGAGPVGLMSACELYRHGIPCRIIDRQAQPHAQSRATDLHARTMEIFYDLGIADEFLACGHRRLGTRLYIEGKCVADYRIDHGDTAFSFDVGHPQHKSERILEDHLERLGGRVERGVRLATIEQDDAGVSAILLHSPKPDEGGLQRWEEVRYPWAIACDGAKSAVRQWLGVKLEGSTFEEAFFLADVNLDTNFSRDYLQGCLSPQGMIVFLPMPGDDTFRIFGEFAPGTAPKAIDQAWCQRLINERAHGASTVRSVGWTSVFRCHTPMVPEYRHGRVFLAGDAAHLHSPVGGHGMNMGVQDAYNLAWKLALVIKGQARPELLDSYGPERTPVARAVLSETDLHTRMFLAKNPIARRLLSGLQSVTSRLPVTRRRAVVSMLGLGVSYRESPIVDEHVDSVLELNLTSREDLESASVRERRDFLSGPEPGDRAPDARIHHEGASSLLGLLRGTAHTLLLFDGDAATAEGYRNLSSIAREVSARWGALLKSFIVIPGEMRPKELSAQDVVLFDQDGALHSRYGATKECLYLIRPDGHVAFRSQPARQDALVEYLARWFVG